MTLSLYAQYAAVTAIFLIAVITVGLSIKSWFDERTAANNLWLANEFNRMNLQRMFGEEDDFDQHVTSAVGMKPFMHTPN